MKFAIFVLLALAGHAVSQNPQSVFVPGFGQILVSNPGANTPNSSPTPNTVNLVVGGRPGRRDPEDDPSDRDPEEVRPRRRRPSRRRPSNSFRGYPFSNADGVDDIEDEILPPPSRSSSRRPRPRSERERAAPIRVVLVVPQQGNNPGQQNQQQPFPTQNQNQQPFPAQNPNQFQPNNQGVQPQQPQNQDLPPGTQIILPDGNVQIVDEDGVIQNN